MSVTAQSLLHLVVDTVSKTVDLEAIALVVTKEYRRLIWKREGFGTKRQVVI